MLQQKSFKKLFQLLLILIFGMYGAVVFAADEEDEEEEEKEFVEYVSLQPSFLTNFGQDGGLHYLKADISIRVREPETAEDIGKHMPFIRNNLVLLFNRQSVKELSTGQGREELRRQALREVKDVLDEMAGRGSENVVDLYFNTFILQTD